MWLQSFLAPSQPQKHIPSRAPFAKDRREEINELQALTFYDAPANDAQTIVAPPKYLFIDFTLFFLLRKNHQKFSVPRRKSKSCKSPETRFPKVSRRSEPSSWGKRPFETFAVRQFMEIGMNGIALLDVIDGYKIDTATSTSTSTSTWL